MPNQRMTRVNELLRREIASCLYRVLDSSTIDLAVLTVTHVVTSPDLRKARVFVSVLGDDAEKAYHMVGVLVANRKQIQKEVSSHVVLKYTPYLNFELDESLVKGDNVLNILDQLDIPSDEPPANPDDSSTPES